MSTTILQSGFYVMDRFGTSVEGAIVSGPHATLGEARAARADCNIAGDCDIIEAHLTDAGMSFRYAQGLRCEPDPH